MIGMNPLAVAIGLAGAGVAVPAISRESAPAAGDIEKVVVTGQRSSLEHSIDIRSGSTQFVKVVTAEDIGETPEKVGEMSKAVVDNFSLRTRFHLTLDGKG